MRLPTTSRKPDGQLKWSLEKERRAEWSVAYWSRSPAFRGEGSATNQRPPESVIDRSRRTWITLRLAFPSKCAWLPPESFQHFRGTHITPSPDLTNLLSVGYARQERHSYELG